MNLKELQKEILRVLKANAVYRWDDNLENTPNQEFKECIKLVNKLFKQYKKGVKK